MLISAYILVCEANRHHQITYEDKKGIKYPFMT